LLVAALEMSCFKWPAHILLHPCIAPIQPFIIIYPSHNNKSETSDNDDNHETGPAVDVFDANPDADGSFGDDNQQLSDAAADAGAEFDDSEPDANSAEKDRAAADSPSAAVTGFRSGSVFRDPAADDHHSPALFHTDSDTNTDTDTDSDVVEK
jgi:hypothetical protein